MSNVGPNASDSGASTIFCPRCGQAMRVAPEHIHTPVACPHCQKTLEPWRLVGVVTPETAPPTAPPDYRYRQPDWAGYSWRNRWVAGALGVLLGGFGVHRFYLGFTGIGIIQIVVTVVTFGTVGPIWGFIEGILCFCGAMRDVDGLPLRS
ncbi:MAG: TM2 domain-containing protein [Phycisphaerae bacterium]